MDRGKVPQCAGIGTKFSWRKVCGPQWAILTSRCLRTQDDDALNFSIGITFGENKGLNFSKLEGTSTETRRQTLTADMGGQFSLRFIVDKNVSINTVRGKFVEAGRVVS
jgi:hypothetical protein